MSSDPRGTEPTAGPARNGLPGLVPALLLLGACAGPSPAPQATADAAREPAPAPTGIAATGRGTDVAVTLDGAPFATVVAGAEPKPYVWPLLGPGGVPVTRAFPIAPGPDTEEHDHPHHVSFWFAHGDVNGFDFWTANRRGTRQVLEGVPEVSADASGVTVRARYRWTAEAGDVLVEERALRFSGTDAARVVDASFVLRPAGYAPVTFGDTKEGTFALRLAPALRLNGRAATAHITNSEGLADDACWGARASWVDYTGVVGGKELGVLILDHPANPRHPTWWHARGYGLFAANPFGQHDFEGAAPGAGALVLAPGESLHFRYRVILHAGAWTADEKDAAWRAFAGG